MNTPHHGDRRRPRTEDAPPQPGVVVLGMHRSGTSAVTRVIDLLGIPVCHPGDRFSDVAWNARGLWESRTACDFDDRLMHNFGGTWWAPPTLRRGWETSPALDSWREEARRLFAAAHPSRQWVWKDPRACILLPFWESAVGVAAARVLLLRHPREIMESLFSRNRMEPRLALALTERHLREALRHCRGRSVLISTFDELLDSPTVWIQRTREFLGTQGLSLAEPAPIEDVCRFLQAGLRHHRRDDALAGEPTLTPEQQRLWEWALRRRGAHDALSIQGLPRESPGTEELIDTARFRARLQLPPRPPSAATLRQRARRRRRPPRIRMVVINHNEGQMLLRTLRGLERTLPERSEIVVVDDCSSDGSPAAVEDAHPGVVVLRARSRLGITAARNLGARHGAAAEVVVWSDAHCEPEDGWVGPTLDALDDPEVGMVAPAIAQLDDPLAQWGYGFVWRDPSMAMRWLPQRSPNAYAVPFLCGCFLAMRGEVLARTGGFDEGLVTWGMEDSELCLRLWLMGYECQAVPAARVRHLFRSRFPYAHDLGLMYHNILRVGAVHFNDERTRRMLRHYGAGGADHFATGMTRLLRGDHRQRREEVDRVRRRDDEWFFARFDTDVFPHQAPPPRPRDVAAARERAAESAAGPASGGALAQSVH